MKTITSVDLLEVIQHYGPTVYPKDKLEYMEALVPYVIDDHKDDIEAPYTIASLTHPVVRAIDLLSGFSAVANASFPGYSAYDLSDKVVSYVQRNVRFSHLIKMAELSYINNGKDRPAVAEYCERVAAAERVVFNAVTHSMFSMSKETAVEYWNNLQIAILGLKEATDTFHKNYLSVETKRGIVRQAKSMMNSYMDMCNPFVAEGTFLGNVGFDKAYVADGKGRVILVDYDVRAGIQNGTIDRALIK